MKKISLSKINENSNIGQALKMIDKSAMQIVVVVDKKSRLIGTITDGDIRRGLLKNMDINSSIKSIITRKPVFAKITDKIQKLLDLANSKKIRQIPLIDKKGIVKKIFSIDDVKSKYYSQKPNKVYLMAGGIGSRLRPLTNQIPKPMLPIGKKPLLHLIIQNLAKHGFKDIVICVNYKSDLIINYFKDGRKFGVSIKYIHEKKKMGTAGSLSLIKQKPKEAFFVMNADLMTTIKFEKILEYHKKYKSKATMCVQQHNFVSPYGEVRLNNEKILSIVEKPKFNFFSNAGIYLLEPECLELVPNKFFDMPSLFNKIIKKKQKAICFPLGEYWLDIGLMKDYKKANNDVYSL